MDVRFASVLSCWNRFGHEQGYGLQMKNSHEERRKKERINITRYTVITTKGPHENNVQRGLPPSVRRSGVA